VCVNEVSRNTGICETIVYSISSKAKTNTDNHNRDLGKLKQYKEYFKKFNINTESIHELSYVANIDILDLFHNIKKNLIPHDTVMKLTQSTKIAFGDILNATDDYEIISNHLSKDSQIVNLCLRLNFNRNQSLDLYHKAEKNIRTLIRQTAGPVGTGRNRIRKMVEARMYCLALLDPEYFDSYSKWKKAFQYCLDEYPFEDLTLDLRA